MRTNIYRQVYSRIPESLTGSGSSSGARKSLETETINVEQEDPFRVIPNPSNGGNVSIRYSVTNSPEIIIFNSFGGRLKEISPVEVKGTVSISTDDFPSGVYHVVLLQNGVVLKITKLVINK